MTFRVKTVIVVFFLFITTLQVKSQTPNTCFEIESILVDACGSPEGENEMVRFAVGPSNLNTNNLNISWPNTSNSYLGICQNATTASKVATLNNSIIGCGLLIEPTSNILPAGAKVILITSTAFNTSANSFANLNDTLYVIFQCPGNTSGHFANYNSSPGIRTLSMSFSSPSGCSDVVSYDRSFLLNQSLNPGSGDGAKVNFAWNNTASYDNEGCNAPIAINSVNITSNTASICPGDTINNLTATANGSFQSILWTGGSGSFSSPTSNNTNYYSSTNDNNNFYIYFNGITTCGDTIKDSVLVQIGNNSSNVNITSSTTELCIGDSILLTANGSGNYTWNTSSNSNSIYVNTPGLYYVTSSTTCGTASDSILITMGAPPIASITGDSIFCGSTLLTATGGTTYQWSNGGSNTSEYFSNSQQVYVIADNGCGTDTAYFNITNYAIDCSISSDYTQTSETPITVNFYNNSTNATNYLWSFGDGNTSTLQNPSNIYTEQGNYNINLTVSNQHCNSSCSYNINIESENTIYIPNVFTPNNDGMNDVFEIKGNNISDINVKIYNRWGENVHNWDGINGFWDGTYQNKLVSDGTYFYIIKVTWGNDTKEQLTGSINKLN